MTTYFSQQDKRRVDMGIHGTHVSPEHIAFALWPLRNRYRNLHATEFKDELSLLVAVKVDLGARNFHDVESAKDFYKDLNHSF